MSKLYRNKHYQTDDRSSGLIYHLFRHIYTLLPPD